MNKFFRALAAIILSAGCFCGTLMTSPAGAISAPAPQVMGVETAILTDCGSKAESDDGSGIFCILNIVLQVLTYGVGIVATIGFVVSGIQYATARDDAGQLSRAKSRMINILIGLFLYASMWALLNFLLPGGLFSNGG